MSLEGYSRSLIPKPVSGNGKPLSTAHPDDDSFYFHVSTEK
jgi:hypothetical protein